MGNNEHWFSRYRQIAGLRFIACTVSNESSYQIEAVSDLISQLLASALSNWLLINATRSHHRGCKLQKLTTGTRNRTPSFKRSIPQQAMILGLDGVARQTEQIPDDAVGGQKTLCLPG